MLSAGAVLLVPCTVRRGIGEAKRLLQNLRHRRAGVCSVLPWPQNLREARSFPCTPSELRREGSSRQAALVMWAQNVPGTLPAVTRSKQSFLFLPAVSGRQHWATFPPCKQLQHLRAGGPGPETSKVGAVRGHGAARWGPQQWQTPAGSRYLPLRVSNQRSPSSPGDV